jgi:hypothetical protein
MKARKLGLGPEFIAEAHLAGQGPPVSVAPAEGLPDWDGRPVT